MSHSMRMLIGMIIAFMWIYDGSSNAAVGTSAAENWYVRPLTECAFNGDGLAYGCATEVGGNGAFTAHVPSNIIWTPTVGVDDGDTLYVCGTQQTPLVVGGSAAGTVSAHIVIRFDCPSNAGKIIATKNMTEALLTSSWVNESGTIWYLSMSNYTWKNPKRVWVNGTEIFPSDTKANLGTAVGTGPVGQFFYDSATSRLYYASAVNPATLITSMVSLVANNGACEYTAVCITSPTNEYIDIVNPYLEGGHNGSVYVLGAKHIHVYGTELSPTHCVIGGKGPRGILISDTSTAGTGAAAQDVNIDHCIIDPVIPTNFTQYTWQWNGGNGDGIAAVYGVQDAMITENIIRNWQHAMLNLAATLGSGSVTGVTARQNQLICDVHIEYCRGFAIDGAAVDRATNNIVTRNLIQGMTVRSQYNGNGNAVTKNLFLNQRQGTVSPTAVQSIDMEGYAGPSQDNVLSQNIFVNNPYGPCISFRAGANIKSGFTIAENMLVGCGGSALVGYENTAIVMQNAASVGNQSWLRNIVVNLNNNDAVFYKSVGQVTVDAFNSGCSGDTCTQNLSFNANGWTINDVAFAYRYICNVSVQWALHDTDAARQYFCVHP